MKTAIILSLSAIIFATQPANAAKRYSDDLYRDVISSHCRAVERDKEERYVSPPRHIPRNTIQIRKVSGLSGGWLRIYGTGNAGGRTAHGYVDFNPRTREVSCPEGNWTMGPYIPLWPMVQDMFRIR